ncbi:MAG: hypothetical protein K5659_09100 [Lachnospiraceae bacterium]|nr:hypothetical protein [Lachnospiraceae bacterium]
MSDKEKIVQFFEYCATCKYKDKSEEEDPCWDCLSVGGNSTVKPVKYEEAEK